MLALAVVALLAWVYLLLFHGRFWRTAQAPLPKPPAQWPRVVAVVPARNEAATIGRAIGSLLQQEYAGEFSVVLVDDQSDDGTAEIARVKAATAGASDRLRVVTAPSLAPGWTGKLAALSAGVGATEEDAPALYLFTDADIAHDPKNLARLVTRLEGWDCDLVSLMVRLNCEWPAEKFMIPAFVYFFAMLYPFARSNNPRRSVAAAAGGCILLRRSAYERIGGLAAIKGELIDDCALARAVKRGGHRIWLGLSDRTQSIRPYPELRDIWDMIARTAFTQLKYSPFYLAGTVVGLGVIFLAPVLLGLAGGVVSLLALAAWALMALTYVPMLRFYGLSALRAPLLPAVALVYLAATMDSAWRHWRGKGGVWKGRVSWQSQR